MNQRKGWRMSCDVGKATEGLENELWRRWNDGIVGEWAESSTLPLLHLRHGSFSNPSFASPTSQALHLIHLASYVVTGFLNQVAYPIVLMKLGGPRSKPYRPNFSSLHLRHSSFSNPSVALPTSQLILQPFRCSTYVTAHSPTFLSLLLSHRIFIYVTWRVAHAL